MSTATTPGAGTQPSPPEPPREKSYPIRVDAELDPKLSRGLWLVKWILAIPHYIVLAFLWLAFVVLSLFAFVSIVITGRYPRGIFDFNVGVLRWSWRVGCYSYGVLSTDRYPPFTLHDVADYPAHLEVTYPERLSRGLALVKWWLLAIPHYVVVAILAGGGTYLATEAVTSEGSPAAWGGGLIGLLVFIAAVVLLFTGRYPRDLFDLVVGMNRWVLRVTAYATLMTDDYPPFRLDMGGRDPGTAATPPPPPPSLPATSEPQEHTHDLWTAGRVVTVVAGCALLLFSGGLLTAGIAAVVVDNTLRDDSGFVTSGRETFSTDSYAIITESIEFHVPDDAAWIPDALLGDVRLTAAAMDGSEVFIGIAPTAAVEQYLDGVAHAVVTDHVGGDPIYRNVPGTEEPAPPLEQDLWTHQTSGTGSRNMTWAPEDGDWTIVLMHADATPNVTAGVTPGAELPALGVAAVVLLAVGGLLLLVSIALIVLAVPRHRASTR